MRHLKACLLVLLLPLAQAGAVTYYVDPSGSDSADGLTTATAWQTLAKVARAAYAAGDTVRFKRGGTWNAVLSLSGKQGTAGRPITFTTWGRGDQPIINSRTAFPGWGTAGNWQEAQPDPFFNDGFESGSLSAWAKTGTGSDLATTNSQKHEGLYGAHFVYNDGTDEYLTGSFAAQYELKVSLWLRFDISGTLTSTPWILKTGRDTGAADQVIACRKSAGKIQLRSTLYLDSGSASSAWLDFASDTNWHHLEYSVKFGAGDGYLQMSFDEAPVYRITGQTNRAHGPVNNLQIGDIWGNPGQNFTWDLDDVTVSPVSTYSGVWKMSTTTVPHRLWFDGTESGEAGEIADVGVATRWKYDSTGHILYCYGPTNPSGVYTTMEYPGAAQAASLTDCDFVTLDNLCIKGGSYQTVIINGGTSITLQSCTLGEDCGNDGVYAGYSANANSSYGLIENCVIDSGDRVQDAWRRSEASGCQDGIRLAPGANYWTVRNNMIKDWGHAGIAVSNTDARKSCNGHDIYGNTLSAPDVDYCRGVNIEGGDGLALNILCHDNTICSFTLNCQLEANGLKFYRNTIRGIRNNSYLDSANGIQLYGYGAPHNMEITSNTITGCDEAGLYLTQGAGSNPVQNNIFRGNTITSCGLASKAGRSNFSIYIKSSANITSNTYDSNYLASPFSADVVYYGQNARNDYPHTVAEFNAENGTAGDVITNNRSTPPSDPTDPTTHTIPVELSSFRTE